MRLKLVRLVNYAGIMNGMGLNQIEIDFTRGNHRMIVIKGDNGSGKSTLFKALTPLPDETSCFIPGLAASKIIEYIDEYNTVYHMEFIHDVKPNGDRIPSKGYIKKISSMGMEELNPSGNITACKDVIYSIFKLDPNFVALSQLSTDDRGLADKKPAERKKFVNSIISSVEVYNNIHKTLTKRSSIFKSIINSILAKIDTIGDIESMKELLTEVEARVATLEKDKSTAMSNIAYLQSSIDILDPDKRMQERYNELAMLIESRDADIKMFATQVKGGGLPYTDDRKKDDREINNKESILKANLADDESELKAAISERDAINAMRNQLAEEYQAKEAKYKSLGSDQNFDDLSTAIENTKKSMVICEELFEEMGLEDGVILSKDEYVLGINTLLSIRESIDNFMMGINDSDLRVVMAAVDGSNPIDFFGAYNDIEAQLDKKISDLANYQRQYSEASGLLKATSILTNRPKTCKIDTCPFVSDAISAQKQLASIDLKALEELISKTESEIEKLGADADRLKEQSTRYNDMQRILRSIDNSRSVLAKLPVKHVLLDKVEFVSRIVNRQRLHEIDTLYRYLDKANVFEDYRYFKEMLTNLEAEYKVYLSKKELIDSLKADLDDLNQKIQENQKRSLESAQHIDSLQYLINLNKSKLDRFNVLLGYREQLTAAIDARDKYVEEYNKLTKDMQTISAHLSKIEVLNAGLDRINVELPKVCQDRDILKHKISMLDEYNKELAQYQGSYDKIETIRYYCSPTTGIQTLFMELYMNKIIELANKLLALLFDGMFHLDQFVINESEFRIPCSGGNLPHDDISSMSSSQIACISMILSFALLYQSASNLNVLKLDEIDGALDSQNRRNFILMLEEMLTTLHCDQCIIISHNDELNLENCDVIVLRQSHIEPIQGNIIWKY